MVAVGTGAALSFRRIPGVRQESLLTLVFEKRGDKWLMVLDQNTPSK